MLMCDYVRWMGIAAWTCGSEFPRRSRGLCLVPGSTPRHVLIQSAGGPSDALKGIEREFTHMQWLLGGSPADETTIDYIHHQDLCITEPTSIDPAFAVLDFRDEEIGCDSSNESLRPDYGPEWSFSTAQTLSSTCRAGDIASHIPVWELAEPLGLLALAVREFLSGSTIRKLTADSVSRLASDHHPPVAAAFGRLAYSLPFRGDTSNGVCAPSSATTITLHVAADDPIFTNQVLERLINRAQAFATVFGSSVDCYSVFGSIKVHDVFPSTIHEPDAEEVPIILYRIPLAVDLLPDCCLPSILPHSDVAKDSLPVMVLHRDRDTGAITARPFECGTSLIDRSIRFGGYVDAAHVIAALQRERSSADSSCLAAWAIPEIIWESLALWGLWPDTVDPVPRFSAVGDPGTTTTVHSVHPNTVSVVRNSITHPLLSIQVHSKAPLGRALHDVCDVLDDLGVWSELDFPISLETFSSVPTDGQESWASSRPPREIAEGNGLSLPDHPDRLTDSTLPCLWPRAVAQQSLAATDRALSLTVVRRALSACLPKNVSWIGIRHSQVAASNKHCIHVAVALARTEGAEDKDARPMTYGASGFPNTDISPTVVEGDLAPKSSHSEFTFLAREISDAITQACATSFPGLPITCDIIDANNEFLPDIRTWVTAVGYHPIFGFLPAYIQLER